MENKNLKLSVLLLVIGLTAQAQQASPAAGGDATGAGGSSAYSVGQVIYTSVSSSAGSTNQGVQQPYVLIATGVNNHPDINLSMSVYPNPSITTITLNVGKQALQQLWYQLFDVQGKLVAEQKITSIETIIKMDEYTMGNYFLKVVDATKELKTFRIIKN